MAGVRGQRSGGHNAKTVADLRAAGTFRADRHAGIANPEPPPGQPKPPKPLTGDAAAEWDRMLERLEASRTLSVVDAGALYQYVQLYAETEQIKADNARIRKQITRVMKLAMKLTGDDLVNALETVAKLEAVAARHAQQLRQGHMAQRQYLVEFGLTPASRGRVKALPGVEKPKSRLIAFMGGKHPLASREE